MKVIIMVNIQYKEIKIFLQAFVTLLSLFKLSSAFWTPDEDEEVKDTVISIQIGGSDIIIPDFDLSPRQSTQRQRYLCTSPMKPLNFSIQAKY